MKIAIDCHTLEIADWAGKEKFLMSLLEEIKKNKENDFILYFRKKVFSYSEFPENFILVNINCPTPFWQLLVLFDLFKKKAAVLLSPCTYLLPAINFICKNVITIHDLTTFLLNTKSTHKLVTRLKEKLLLGEAVRNCKKVIAVSESTKADCLKFFKTSPEKIEVVYLAATFQLDFSWSDDVVSAMFDKYDLPQDYILSVGTLEPRKNLIGLIRAYKALREECRNIKSKLVIVGKRGWYYKEIFNEIKKLSFEQEVIFTGYLPDEAMPYLYNGARCLVYPSFYEGFGLPVLEAMSCGCPVITSNTSSLPEVAGKAAILVNPYDYQDIMLALKTVLTDEIKRTDLIYKGLAQAKNFSWPTTGSKILSIINNLK